MRALILILTLAVAACGPVLTPPDRPLTAAEARGLALLHELRAADPCEADPTCAELRRAR